jgi:acetyl esterase/lipase
MPQTIPLWPGAAPLARNEADAPAITVYLADPELATGAAVIICPGGGYTALMESYEGHDIARWLLPRGVAGIVLKYRVGIAHPAPLLDAQRAIRTVRLHAAEWKINPGLIGIMGFSAGGHLASAAGVHSDAGDAKAADPVGRMSSRPDFLVLVYPVITMTMKTHAGTRSIILGPAPTPQLVDFLSSEKQVTAQTPPTFLAHSIMDSAVPVDNSRLFAEACKAHNVSVEYLELPTGDHGLGCGNSREWDAWQARCLEWFASRGIVKS